MEGKAIGMLVAFALIASFAGGLSFYLEVESKRQELSEVQTQVTNATALLENKRTSLDSMRAKVQGLREQIDGHVTLGDSKATLTTDIIGLETARNEVLKEFTAAVQKVRVSSVGMPWPDVKLANGQVLTGVAVQKLTDTDVSLAHSGGVSKIGVSELPTDLKERFRYGMVPMIPYPEASASKPASGGVSSPAPAPPPPPPATAGAPNAEQDRVQFNNTIIHKVASLENQIKVLERARMDWSDRAMQHRGLGDSAQQRGRPASTHFANAAAADQQAAAVTQQINAIHLEISQLRMKMK